jgi:hypothetical protein
MFKNIGKIFTCMMLLTGCKSTYVYTLDSLEANPSIKTTILTADSEYEHGILIGLDEKLHITSINGESTHNFVNFSGHPEIARIPIGENKIGLRFSHAVGVGKACVLFTAEEGKTYTATKSREGRMVSYWVIEDETQKMVSIPC